VKQPEKRHRSAWTRTRVAGHWDEAFTPAGMPRRQWRDLAVAIGEMGQEQWRRAWQAGQQLIRANGTSFNVTGELSASERSWPLDPIPLILDEREWAEIERAIVQRATLLNLLLTDLYGPQRLVSEGLIPAALALANPHFLRPCHGIQPRSGVFLHSYAADMARSPDGRWWITSDRTQAPSGLGYSLENRLVSARTLSQVFSSFRLRQLAHFFDVRRDALLNLAASQQHNPRIVMLTPGPHSETYFEHSFLAGHWGFPLVEGGDLAVRDNRVYLKTLTGLDPVDLIVRRLDDDFCDPLELRGDSLLGVPGLLQAARSGNVTIDNALGSGALEAPGFMAFLPGLCRHLLGEELRLPSVATWWCGQAPLRRYVFEHLDELVIRPAFPRSHRHMEIPAQMTARERRNLIARIEAAPERFIAQEQVALSTAPVYTDEGLSARHVVLRVFAAWDGSSYTVLPGGLTRVSREARSPAVSLHNGGGTKDTWVPGGEGEPLPLARPATGVIAAHPSWANLPSRVADNLFWLGRYAERLEDRVRLVRALLPALSGEEDFGRTATLESVVRLLAGLEYLPPEIAAASLGEQLWRVQRLLANLVRDESGPTGLRWNLKQMRRVALNLKERLSADTWRVLQQIERDFARSLPSAPNQSYAADISLLDRALDRVIVTLSAFVGLVMENTTRGPGWHFLEIGRRLERVRHMAELLQAGVAEAPEAIEPYLRILLYVADSSITYRTRYLTTLRTDLVLDLLLVDEANPRSIGFQFASLLDHLEKLPEYDHTTCRTEKALVSRALHTVRVTPVTELALRGEDGQLGALTGLLQQLKADMYDLSDALVAHYLTPVVSPRFVSSL
jgi:uncharacterized circularly permuted ATP-grasp superfamily protein/uncharacterized alpha-E superfamily protein